MRVTYPNDDLYVRTEKHIVGLRKIGGVWSVTVRLHTQSGRKELLMRLYTVNYVQAYLTFSAIQSIPLGSSFHEFRSGRELTRSPRFESLSGLHKLDE